MSSPTSPSLIADLVSVLREALPYVQSAVEAIEGPEEYKRASLVVAKINLMLVRGKFHSDMVVLGDELHQPKSVTE